MCYKELQNILFCPTSRVIKLITTHFPTNKLLALGKSESSWRQESITSRKNFFFQTSDFTFSLSTNVLISTKQFVYSPCKILYNHTKKSGLRGWLWWWSRTENGPRPKDIFIRNPYRYGAWHFQRPREVLGRVHKTRSQPLNWREKTCLLIPSTETINSSSWRGEAFCKCRTPEK